MFVKFLNPAKFPNLRSKGKYVEPMLSFSSSNTSIGINMSLFEILKANMPNFPQIQLMQTEPKTPADEIKYYIFPCKTEGFEIKFKKKTSSCHFASKGLGNYFRDVLNIPDNIKIVKIPVSDTITKVNEISCFELLISKIIKTEKTK